MKAEDAFGSNLKTRTGLTTELACDVHVQLLRFDGEDRVASNVACPFLCCIAFQKRGTGASAFSRSATSLPPSLSPSHTPLALFYQQAIYS